MDLLLFVVKGNKDNLILHRPCYCLDWPEIKDD